MDSCTIRKQSQKSTCTSIVLDTDEMGESGTESCFGGHWAAACVFAKNIVRWLRVYEVPSVMLAAGS